MSREGASGDDRSRTTRCQDCGVELDADDRFCWNCGTDQRSTSETTAGRAGPNHSDSRTSQNGRDGRERRDRSMEELEPLIEKSGLDPSPSDGRDRPATAPEFADRPSQPAQGGIDWSSDTRSGTGQAEADDDQGLVALLLGSTDRNESELNADAEPWRTYGANTTDSRFADRDSNTTLAAAAHVLGLFTSVLGPAVIYAVSNDRFVRRNAANAMSWQLMVLIYGLGSLALASLLPGGLQLLFGLLFVVVPLLDILFVALSGIKANDGIAWEYPLAPSPR